MIRVTPENVTELLPGQSFVFGSNLAGVHGAGAAKLAYDKFGAEWYVGVGQTGDCYAIPSKDERIMTLNKERISVYVNQFIRYAMKNIDNTFLVTEIGCGLAGYEPEDIAPMFIMCANLDNVHLPQRFWDHYEKYLFI